MKRQIRKSVFETNSSSMHSLTVMPNGNMDDLIVDELENKVITEFGEFGWGEDISYRDAATKLSYLMTMIIELNHDCISVEEFYKLEDFKRVNEVVSNYCHCDGIKVKSKIKKYCEEFGKYYNEHDGYVDHESVCSIDHLLTAHGKCTIEEFIFDTGIELIIDRDNY